MLVADGGYALIVSPGMAPEFILGRNSDPEGVPVLLELLADSAWEVRRSAACSLGTLGAAATKAAPHLSAALGDAHPMVRVYAAAALGKIRPKDKASLDALSRCAEDQYTNVRFTAAVAHHHISGDVDRFVKKMAEHVTNNDQYQFSAMLELQQIGARAKNAIPILIQRLKDEREPPEPAEDELPGDRLAFMRRVCIETLGTIGKDAMAAVPEIRKKMEKDGRDVAVAALALYRITGDPEASVDVLLRIIRNDINARHWCIQSLGKIGPAASKSAPVLAGLLNDDGAGREAAIALALIDTSNVKAAQRLGKIIAENHPDSSLCIDAVQALEQMGVVAKEAVPGLIAAIEKFSDRSDRLLGLLRSIDPQEAVKLSIKRNDQKK
jgi:HEAT repeat protein